MRKRNVTFIIVIVMVLSMIPVFSFAGGQTKVSLAAPKLELYSSGNQSITTQWAKVKGAEKYQLYRAESINGNYINIRITCKNKYKDTKVKGNKTYYYKIRAYKTQKGKKVYSKFSPVSTAKACGIDNINIGYKVQPSSSESNYIVVTITNKSNYYIRVDKQCAFYTDSYARGEYRGTLYKASNDKTISPKHAAIKPGKEITLKYRMSEPVKATNKTLFGVPIKFHEQYFGLWLCNKTGWFVES